MNDPLTDVTTAPAWVPLWLDSVWTTLARYPLLLSLVILASGLLLAVVTRYLLVYWGGRITARTRTTLDTQLVRLLAGVAAVTRKCHLCLGGGHA